MPMLPRQACGNKAGLPGPIGEGMLIPMNSSRLSRNILVLASFAAALHAQTDWNKPFPPHKVMGSLYFVGTEALANFLIATPEGNILINSDFETTVPQIISTVQKQDF